MTNLTVYRCPQCGKDWMLDLDCQVSCLVRHPRGQCCHYGEQEVTVTFDGPEVGVVPVPAD